MTVERKETDPVKADPVGTDPVETDPAEAEPAGTEPQPEATALADLTATVLAMGRQLDDLSAAITAIANQGSVNESIKQDSHGTDEVEYPTIDIDGINRLLGV